MNDMVPTPPQPKQSLVARIAERYGVEPAKMLDTLKATAFKSDKPVTNEQMMALLVVAEQHRLNPFTKEIFAFPDKGGIVPVVSLDGWARIINEHPALDGIAFDYEGLGTPHLAITCTLWRKDRAHPVRVTEFLSECKRNTTPWGSHPLRMLRHKSLIQCARLAFGFAGIYDQDEAERIVNMGDAEQVPPPGRTQRIVEALSPPRPAPATVADSPAVTREPEAPVPTFAQVMSSVLHAPDHEEAALALDMARGYCTESQYEELTAAYRGKWQPNQE